MRADMYETITFVIPDGFQVMEEHIDMDIADVGFLRTKRQRHYTSASRSGTRATLTRHTIRCPYCDFRSPAYEKATPVPPRVIDAWAQPQLSFFDEEDQFLTFNQISPPEKAFFCPNCLLLSTPAKHDLTVSMGEENRRVFLSLPISAAEVMKTAMDFGVAPFGLHFPFRQSFEFDLDTGRACFSVTDATGDRVITRDITDTRELSDVFDLWLRHNRIRRKLRKTFESGYGDKLPYPENDLSLRKLIEVTRFQHFPQIFYDAIPYLHNGTIDPSFTAAPQLRNMECLPKIYLAAGLPAAKSIRRIWFSNPGFFWYIEEAKMLREIFPDVNIYCRLLSLPHIYEIFSSFHQYPGILTFFRDYVRLRGQQILLRKMTKYWHPMVEYAKTYSLMNPSSRERDQAKWAAKDASFNCFIEFSIPYRPGFNQVKDHTSVDGYTFSWLKTRQEYYEAGRAMRNCLTGWTPEHNPVMIVRKGTQPKAALEIKNNLVVQERGFDNAPLSNDPALYEAVSKWKDLQNLKTCTLEIPEFDEDEELPF